MSSSTAEPPVHIQGKQLSSPPRYTTVATFPAGTFLENLAVRRDGSILVSDMLSGTIWYVDPRAQDGMGGVKQVWQFESETGHGSEVTSGAREEGQGKDEEETETETETSLYSPHIAAEAIIESPLEAEADVFYIFAGIHGKRGTWYVYSLDLRDWDPVASSSSPPIVRRLAAIPTATWLNGGTAVPHPASPLILMAESYQGRLYAYDLSTYTVDTWLDHAYLGKMTSRPPWPGVNGVQYHRGWVYFTNSDRGVLGRVRVDMQKGIPAYKVTDGDRLGSGRDQDQDGAGNGELDIELVATGCCGDDLALDDEGNCYVATNPMNTVLKVSAAATSTTAVAATTSPTPTAMLQHNPDRTVLLGLLSTPGNSSPNAIANAEGGEPHFDPETTGPTAVAFGRTVSDRRSLYVTTCGGIIHPLDGVVREAKVLRIDLDA